MNSKDLLLGIDVGTTGTKCTVYDLNGRIAEAAYQDYPMIHKFPTWTEQDPDVWWSCVCVNLRKCFAGGKLDSSRIAAIGLSCTNAVCLVDENGKVLHNAIGLHDQRSGAQVEWLEKKSDLTEYASWRRTNWLWAPAPSAPYAGYWIITRS